MITQALLELTRLSRCDGHDIAEVVSGGMRKSCAARRSVYVGARLPGLLIVSEASLGTAPAPAIYTALDSFILSSPSVHSSFISRFRERISDPNEPENFRPWKV